MSLLNVGAGEMSAGQNVASNTARISKKIESKIHSAIACYEEQHHLKWCHGSYDPDEIKESAEMLLAARDTEVCICVGYTVGYRNPALSDDCLSEDHHRTSRIHLHGNAAAFTVELREPGTCINHENVLIPQLDPLSKGKAALLQEAESGNASAMFTLICLFDEGIGEPQNPVEAYFWHFVGMEFYEYHWDGEDFVDAAGHQETLAAKLPGSLANENSSLHRRATDWIRAHRAFLHEGREEHGEYFDDDFDEIENEQGENYEG